MSCCPPTQQEPSNEVLQVVFLPPQILAPCLFSLSDLFFITSLLPSGWIPFPSHSQHFTTAETSPMLLYLLHWSPFDYFSAPGGLVRGHWFHPVKFHGPWWAPGGTGNLAHCLGVRQNDVYPSLLRSVAEHQGEGWHLLPCRGTLNKTGASCKETEKWLHNIMQPVSSL